MRTYDIICSGMTELSRDPLSRFSDRAEDYAKYRPHYSHDVVHALQEACGLISDHLIADVGCGPGMLAEIFLENGNRVIGVEPNREMRIAGEKYLAGYPNFRSIEGSAENTTLAAASVDFVIAPVPDRTQQDWPPKLASPHPLAISHALIRREQRLGAP